MDVRIANEKTLISSLSWACAVCLVCFGRQLVLFTVVTFKGLNVGGGGSQNL